jgi:thiol-disulfide isomerase/thioredoxin
MCKIEAFDKSFQRYTLFIDEGVTHIDGCNEDGELQLNGTPVADDLNSFNLAIKRNVEELRNGKRSAEEADSISDKLISNIIIKHKDDILGIKILTGMGTVSLSPVLWLNLLEQMNPKFYTNPKLANYLSETKTKMETYARTWVGEQFVDFSVEYKGETTHLSDYVGRGQYILADFWASWCGPCKQQIPELIALYQQYKDKGLILLGIAVRDKEEKTKQAINDLGIPYPQIINAQDIPASLYGIDAIPHTILFDPNGIIIARNIYGNELKAKLEEIFGK